LAEEELRGRSSASSRQPRDIIDAKYDDLNSKLTETWNEENVEQFIPQTGRIDPLTRVSSAVPDDLKPPRSGETDENQIQTYLVSSAASVAVELIARSLICHNVIQIGLVKVATFSPAGQPVYFRDPRGPGHQHGHERGRHRHHGVAHGRLDRD
jgi:hypothetical protein